MRLLYRVVYIIAHGSHERRGTERRATGNPFREESASSGKAVPPTLGCILLPGDTSTEVKTKGSRCSCISRVCLSRASEPAEGQKKKKKAPLKKNQKSHTPKTSQVEWEHWNGAYHWARHRSVYNYSVLYDKCVSSCPAAADNRGAVRWAKDLLATPHDMHEPAVTAGGGRRVINKKHLPPIATGMNHD
ncbi:hypothetical protein LZ31DRAFT_259462 [Colletotrichum somersetense]|nr:hypothetical protein LZ31DRAFT_259462 [Colletotrichum somersetense]